VDKVDSNVLVFRVQPDEGITLKFVAKLPGQALEMRPVKLAVASSMKNDIVGGVIPREYFSAIEKGVREAADAGVLAGYPVTDVKITVYDGSYHPVDSSEICFKIAGAGALKKGLSQAQPVILEPIMNITVRVPEDYTGDIIGDLNTKRAGTRYEPSGQSQYYSGSGATG
jgi:elongation factor G